MPRCEEIIQIGLRRSADWRAAHKSCASPQHGWLLTSHSYPCHQRCSSLRKGLCAIYERIPALERAQQGTKVFQWLYKVTFSEEIVGDLF